MSVYSYKNTTFLTHKRSERATDREKMTPSLPLSLEKRPGHEPPRRQGRATPLHTSTPSPRARRRDRPAPRYTRSSSGDPAHSHVIPKGEQYPNQAASHSKITLDAKGSASKDHQPRTRSSTASSTPPHRTSRETRQQSGATKARSRRRVPTETHSARPQKHERRAR